MYFLCQLGTLNHVVSMLRWREICRPIFFCATTKYQELVQRSSTRARPSTAQHITHLPSPFFDKVHPRGVDVLCLQLVFLVCLSAYRPSNHRSRPISGLAFSNVAHCMFHQPRLRPGFLWWAGSVGESGGGGGGTHVARRVIAGSVGECRGVSGSIFETVCRPLTSKVN